MSLIDDLRGAQAQIATADLVDTRIRLSLKVPYGRVLKQWDAHGRLHIWVHRGFFYDFIGPRVQGPSNPTATLLSGIPIYHEET